MDTPPRSTGSQSPQSSTGTQSPIPSEIKEFFRNKSIFITGATGFLGKTLVEKLLRSCYDIDKIYLLVRAKRGKSTDERMDSLTNCKLFDKVKKMHPDFKEKLIGINGDLLEPFLGISEEDKETLIKNVQIVYHSAATVRFDEPMKMAVNMNIRGVKKVIELCKQLENLISFVHISTAYANCDQKYVDEKVYNPPLNVEKFCEACEWINDDVIDLITPKVIQSKPNTYTYTKQIAESVILAECKDLPVSIIRPSIIACTWKEPFPGWVENFNGPTALFPASGVGVLRTMLGNSNATADMIPVDITVNLMVAVAWHTAIKIDKKKIHVFNNTSGQINKVTWGMLEAYGRETIKMNPYENTFFTYPDTFFTSNKFVVLTRTFFEQIIPAYLMDFCLTISNQRTKFVKIQEKLKKAVPVLEFFTMNQWEFTNDNIYMLLNKLNETDRQLFNFDVTELDWRDYIKEYCLGTKVHLMKEDISKIPELRQKTRNHQKKLKILKVLILNGMFMMFFRYILMRSKYVGFIFQFICNLVLKLGKNLLKYVRFMV